MTARGRLGITVSNLPAVSPHAVAEARRAAGLRGMKELVAALAGRGRFVVNEEK